MSYAELEIRLTKRDDGATAVALRYRAAGSDAAALLAIGTASFDQVALRELSLDPNAYGRRLTQMLFANLALASAWAKALSAAQGAGTPIRVRLDLDPEDTELNALRWETLRDPETPAGLPLVADQNVLLTRLPASADLRPVILATRRALRVAAVVANPTDLASFGFQPLDPESEISRLQVALAPFSPTILTRGTPDGSPTLPALLGALRDGADIVIIIAHGSTSDGESLLWLEQDDATAHPVQGSALAAQIAALDRRPLLVFLAACRSAGDADDQTSLTGVAPLLGQAGVPAVIAMQGNLSMVTMARLMPAFLRELQRDGQADRALAAARSTVLDQVDWWMPALFLRSRSGRVWAEGGPHTVPAGLRMPYRDLDPFTQEQSDLFFGRRALIEEGLTTWREGERRFLAVVGASGSGKSSLAQAGLLPRFKQDLYELSITSEIVIIRPGARPLIGLSDELRRREISARTDLARALAETPALLSEVVSQWGREGSAPRTLLLLIDQFEELFTLCKDEAERSAFVAALVALVAADDGAASLLITLRSDFYRYSAELALRPWISGRQLLVRALSQSEMEEAIVAPVRLVAGNGSPGFEPGLVPLMVEETGSSPGALPLLQYSMGQLWRAGSLTLDAYRGFGGVRGALEQRAELVYNDPALNESDRAGIRQLLLELVQLGEGAEDTRRRVALAELSIAGHTPEQTSALVKRLADARLVTTSEDNDKPTVSVSHEALIRGWSRLRGWIDQDREALRVERQVVDAARLWEEHQREAGYLYSGARLAQAEEWAARAPERVSDRVRVFLAASASERERSTRERDEQVRTRRRSRIFAWATSGLIVLALLISGLAFSALQQRDLALRTGDQLATANVLTGAERDRANQAAQTAVVAQTQVAQLQQETLSRRLAEAAQNQFAERPYLALLLAVEAERRVPVAEADAALREVLGQKLYPSLTLAHSGVRNAEWSRDESRVFTFGTDATVKMWEASTGELLFSLTHNGLVEGASWSNDETRILTYGDDDTARVWDGRSGALLLTLAHAERVGGAVWNRDEARILTYSDDGTARVWDAHVGSLLLTLTHGRSIDRAGWNRAENRILTTSGEGTVKLWDANNGRLLFTLAHAGWIVGARWSHDDSRLLTYASGGAANVWDAGSGALLVTLEHANRVSGAEWNRDESHVLTYSTDGMAKVWDGDSGALLLNLSHNSSVNGAMWNRDESRILTFAADGTVKMWDASSGVILFTLPHDGHVEGAKWNGDESRILTYSFDGTAKVWDGGSGALLGQLPHAGFVYGAKWNRDESRILTYSNNGMVKVWDASNGALLALLAHDGTVAGAIWSRDESRILTFDWGGIARVWEIVEASDHLAPLTFAHTADVGGASWSGDERRVLTYSQDGTAKMWDGGSGKLLFTLSHAGGVIGAQWSQDERRVLTYGEDGTAKMWDGGSGKLLFTLTLPERVTSAVLSRDERRILTYSVDGTTKMWDGGSGKLLFTLAHSSSFEVGAEWSGDERHILTYGEDSTAKMWDSSSGKLLFTLAHKGRVIGAEWSGDGHRLLTYSEDQTARMWKVSSGELLFTLPHASLVNRALWSRNASRVLTYSADGTAKVWDGGSGALLFTLAHDEWVASAVWNRDERRILTRSTDGTAKVWDASSGRLLFTLPHDDFVAGATWNEDESRLLTYSEDGTAKVWDASTGALLFTMVQASKINGALWSRDESGILTYSADGRVNVWEGSSGRLLFSLTHAQWVNGAAWNRDETRLLTYSSDGTAQVHFTLPADLLAHACRYVTRNLSQEEWNLYLPGEPYERTCPNLPSGPGVE